MALQRFVIDGYGQVEINNCAFRRDGRIEAQCTANTSDFATAKVENGMILAVDNAKREVGFAAASNELPVALVYSAEHIYDERTPGLKNFALNGDGSEEFLPRLGYLAVGDKYTTNCFCFDSTEYSDNDAFLSALDALDTAPIYATISTVGAPVVSSSAPSAGLKMRVVRKTTMPDGQPAVMFQVYAD